VADIIRSAGRDFVERNRHWLRWTHLKVLRAIARCRTAALGGHIDECTNCGHRATISYNSCRNRHCPKCQTGARERWIAARRRELLPTPYVHVVFTLPPQLAFLALQNKKLIYGLLLRASAETLLEVARNPAHFGAEIGFFSVLHTWNQKVQLHPMSTVSFQPADSPAITPAGFDPPRASSFPSPYCGACFVASSSLV
jgi:transposase-like zinc-binding protein